MKALKDEGAFPAQAAFHLGAELGVRVAQRRHPHLSLMLFWFPASESSQPIALLELGEAFARPALPLVVGAAPGYPRYQDVLLQTRCARPHQTVYATLTEVIHATQRHLRSLSGVGI